MNRPPDFDNLMEGVAGGEDRDRLRRVHELLVEAGPPPELSPALASAPVPGGEADRTPWYRRRRLVPAIAFAAALLAATFALGYLAGRENESAINVRDTFRLTGERGASGVIELGFKGEDGNWPMLVKVRGLEPLRGGDYYSLQLTKRGKPIVTCGTFNVAGGDATSIRMVAAYNLEGFDGWVVTLWDAQTHDEKVVLRTT